MLGWWNSHFSKDKMIFYVNIFFKRQKNKKEINTFMNVGSNVVYVALDKIVSKSIRSIFIQHS